MTAVLRQLPLPPPRTSSLQNQQFKSDHIHSSSTFDCKMDSEMHEMRFGDYILGQTLGEGEFGKVKLGWPRKKFLQSSNGQARANVEVAIKLIRKDSINGSRTRLNKIKREICILQRVCHPNIVRLFDVIETSRYIGIILEYASGGELFDFILVHRYLKDNVASKLFAQLVSGVLYLHKKGIVHRDLKLENLLLDRNKNIIVTDFGFANIFDVGDNLNSFRGIDCFDEKSLKRGDLMQTSCGSPCYAAPELVVGEGCYVGKKVDVWSCGVILYAMLAGYLPFDDDPNNPDGDNINLLYKYIISTPLTFPEYVSALARDLLKRLLVPDPKKRASLQDITIHPWLIHHMDLFDISISPIETSITSMPLDKKRASSNIMSQLKSNFKVNREKYNSHFIHSGLPLGYVFKGQQTSPTSNKHKRHTVHIDCEKVSIRNNEHSDIVDQAFGSKRSSVDDFNDLMSTLDISSSMAQNSISCDSAHNPSLTLTPVSEDNKVLSSKIPKVSVTPQLNRLPVPLKKPRPTSYQSPVGIFEGSNTNLLYSHVNAHNNQSKRNTTFISTTSSIPSKAGFFHEKNDLYTSRAVPSLLPIPVVSKNAELSRPLSPLKYTPVVTADTQLGALPSDGKHIAKKSTNTHKRASNSISVGAERLFGKIWNGNLHHSSRSLSFDKNKNTPCVTHVNPLTHTGSETTTKLNIKNKIPKISKQKKVLTSNNVNEKNSTTRVMDWFIRRRKNKDVT
ncbi:hypothetical protein PORY_001509 [Pneumocystis oryctolagi]|uniref:Uncharacterized protein n=1 Tax=Pneumocystis oryctolagi TaxID=42067 RepID=A0ACB7CEM8_9ASCO|nr:hypothetical protein PORY_001509 [Pneumocystis oryctolagi]